MSVRLVHEIRLGAVRASIWQENGSDAPRHSVTVSRAFSNGPSRLGNRFDVDELPLVAELMDLAHLWIFKQAELIA
jgi:hypothetical protein